MKTIYGILALAISVCLFSGCANTAFVQKADNFNIKNVRTYAWVNGTQKEKDNNTDKSKVNDLTDTKIRASINRNLQANGFREVKENPDVLLVYDVDIQKENRNETSPVYSQPFNRWFYNPYTGRYVSVYYPSQFMGYNETSRTVKEGTITLTLMDSHTDKTLWQGWVSSDLYGKRMTDKDIDNNVKAIVKKMS